MTDVCLILEGTYPYVAGGVSTWVYELIKGMRDTSFSIVYLGPHRPMEKKLHYDIPRNVVDFREHYIFDYSIKPEKSPVFKSRKRNFDILERFLLSVKDADSSGFDEVVEIMGGSSGDGIGLYDFVRSFEAWKILERVYEKEARNVSFIDYFWTWRFIYLPFFSLLKIKLPMAKLYHSPSTGYAGMMGALAKTRYSRPLIITEHGIYTRERKIEISQADWIYSDTARELKVTEGKDFFKEWWLGFFSFLSRAAYDKADKIITLFEGNRLIQIEEGAKAELTSVIPNGIQSSGFSSLKKIADKNVFRIGFMGRVVPIKDLKTFIRSVGIIHDDVKTIEAYIMGPTDEDEDYYRECLDLVEMEGLKDICFFTGKIDVKEYYPQIDIIVLTSLSEGQPIVILESFASGIPVVATDVGSCHDLIYGARPDDRLLGEAGIITPICNPGATARAVTDILGNKNLYNRMAETAIKRVKLYYELDNLIADYKAVYSSFTREVRWLA